jgi:hypothetical protein
MIVSKTVAVRRQLQRPRADWQARHPSLPASLLVSQLLYLRLQFFELPLKFMQLVVAIPPAATSPFYAAISVTECDGEDEC